MTRFPGQLVSTEDTSCCRTWVARLAQVDSRPVSPLWMGVGEEEAPSANKVLDDVQRDRGGPRWGGSQEERDVLRMSKFEIKVA